MHRNEDIIPRLKGQISRAQVVLFTGAGFSRGAKDRSNRLLPTVRELREDIWNLVFRDKPFDPDATLGELYAVALRRNRPALRALLESRFSVDPNSLPDYYQTFFIIPWYRVYTLNVDDLESAVSRKFSITRQPLSISALRTEKGEVRRPGGRTVEVVHLNGMIGDPPELMTFSETQYAERIANQEPWYARCAVDLQARPTVFIGTELREETLWQHMELRRRRQPQESSIMPPGSILVSPALSLTRAEMLQALNIDWYEGTAESFEQDILRSLFDEAHRGFIFLESYEEDFGRIGIPLASELAAERPTLQTEYLLGGEPHWSDIINGRAVVRTSNATLLETALEVLDGKKTKAAIAVTGTAGSGKSTTLMWLALELSNRGLPVLWIDKDSTAAPLQIRKRLMEFDGKLILAIDDADLFGMQLSNFLRDIVPIRPELLVVLAVRAGRFDDLLGPVLRSGTMSIIEHIVPNLTDDDIEKLIGVLDANNRLGILKGASPDARRKAFADKAGRQLLVAMIEATSGEKFEEKAENELDQLEGVQKLVYALVSVATTQRQFLTKDEIMLAVASAAEDGADALNRLVNRHLIVATPPYYQYRARHRVIADLVLEHLIELKQLKPVMSGIAYAAASKVDRFESRKSRSWRLLARFTNHELLLSLLGPMDGRDIYAEIENLLASEYHYWLQRGSLEVENGDLRLAEHFLNQARSLNSEDYRIDTEYGYMLMRKAIDNPTDHRAQEWIDSATQMLEGVIASRGGADHHPFHVLGSQGLAWVRRSSTDKETKRKQLSYYLDIVEEGLKKHPLRRDLNQLQSDLKREILMTAVTP